MTSSSSPNQRALRRLIALAILSGLVVIALFFAIEERQIASRARSHVAERRPRASVSAAERDAERIRFCTVAGL